MARLAGGLPGGTGEPPPGPPRHRPRPQGPPARLLREWAILGFAIPAKALPRAGVELVAAGFSDYEATTARAREERAGAESERSGSRARSAKSASAERQRAEAASRPSSARDGQVEHRTRRAAGRDIEKKRR